MMNPIRSALLYLFLFSLPATGLQGQIRFHFNGGGWINSYGEGFKLGTGISRPLAGSGELMPELVFSQKPVAPQLLEELPAKDLATASAYHIDLHLPVSFGFEFGSWSLYFHTGAYLSRMIQLEGFVKTELNARSWQRLRLKPDKNAINAWELGWLAGSGIKKEISQGNKIFLQGQYLLGLTDIDRHDSLQFYNNAFTVCLGIDIPLGEEQ